MAATTSELKDLITPSIQVSNLGETNLNFMKIKTKLLPITCLPSSVPHGYGNGYVGVPPEHPWYGLSYDEIHEKYPNLSVHGGLTYSDSIIGDDESPNTWWVGFDTCHLDDNKITCDERYCETEVESLKQQALDALNV